MQRYKAIDYCAKNNILLEEDFEDRNVSARKKKIEQRPGLNMLIQQIKAKTVNQIIVYKRDRLARDVEEHLELYNIFKEYNVSVKFTADNEISMVYSPIGEFIESILGAISESEGKQIAERIKATKIANFLSGKSIGNYPYGFMPVENNNNDKQIIINTDEFEVIKIIFDRLGNLNKPVQEIFTELNLNNRFRYRFKNNKSKDWDSKSIIDIIRHPIYSGIQVFNDKENDKRHTREIENIKGFNIDKKHLISNNLWKRANDNLDKQLENQIKRVKYITPISDFVYCLDCKTKMKITSAILPPDMADVFSNERLGFAQCGEKGCSNKISINNIFENLHHYLDFYIKSLFKDDFKKLYNRQQEKNLKFYDKKIQEIKKVISDAENSFITNMKEWVSKNKKLSKTDKADKEYENIKACRETLVNYYLKQEEIKKFGEKIRDNISYFDSKKTFLVQAYEVQLELYTEILEKIYVNNEKINIYFKHPFLAPRGEM
jgi:DNA invertase Pin-like site-specific DNA recombinase